MFKIVILLFMFVIVLALGSGLFFLVQDKGNTNRTVKALSWRIGLSLSLFVLLFVAFSMGWIRPHGI